MIAYFAYGTTQQGFAHHRRLAGLLGERVGADARAAYPRELAAAEDPKDCCVRSPGHRPPHDVIDPLS